MIYAYLNLKMLCCATLFKLKLQIHINLINSKIVKSGREDEEDEKEGGDRSVSFHVSLVINIAQNIH